MKAIRKWQIGFASLATVYVATTIGLGFTFNKLCAERNAWQETRTAYHQIIEQKDAEIHGIKMLAEKRQQEAKSVASLIKKLHPRIKPALLHQIDRAILQYAEYYDLPPELVVYVMKRESNFHPRAKSSVGAIGLMQVFPKWHKDKMKKMGITYSQVYEINNNVRLGCWILRNYINETGSIDLALTKYVGGKHPQYVSDILVGFTNGNIFE